MKDLTTLRPDTLPVRHFPGGEYVSPQIQITRIAVEAGFQASAEPYDWDDDNRW